MADVAETTSNAPQPASAISGNAPPTPPETQDIKATVTTSGLPPVKPQPVKIGEAPPAASEPDSVKDGVAAAAAAAPDKPLVPIRDPAEASKPVDLPQATSSNPKQKLAQAEELAAQPEKLEETATSDAKPINAEASAPATTGPATDGDAKPAPKPVSVEEVQDAELPAAKPVSVSEPKPAEDAAKPAADAGPKDAQDVDMTKVSQAKTPPQDVPKPEPETAPAPSEPAPKTGDKRKAAEEDVHDNIDAAAPPAAAPERRASPEKKQKLDDPADHAEAAATKKRRGSKKEKKAPLPVGRTARKTRSQGAAEVDVGL